MSDKILDFNKIKQSKELTEYVSKYNLHERLITEITGYVSTLGIESREGLEKYLQLDINKIKNDLNRFFVSGCKVGIPLSILPQANLDVYGIFLMNNTVLGDKLNYVKFDIICTKTMAISLISNSEVALDTTHELYDETLYNEMPYLIPASVVNGISVLIRDQIFKNQDAQKEELNKENTQEELNTQVIETLEETTGVTSEEE